MKQKEYKSKEKITTDTMTGRGGMALFVRYYLNTSAGYARV